VLLYYLLRCLKVRHLNGIQGYQRDKIINLVVGHQSHSLCLIHFLVCDHSSVSPSLLTFLAIAKLTEAFQKAETQAQQILKQQGTPGAHIQVVYDQVTPFLETLCEIAFRASFGLMAMEQ
jgi:hypothetical protein